MMSQIFLENTEINVNNIFCIGRNYVAHVEELKNEIPSEPVVFLKPNSSVINSGHIIHLPKFSHDVHFECELVLLIGQDSDGLKKDENALDWVAGYGVGLDLTARDIQNNLKEKGLPWLKAKGFKHSACVSSFISAKKLSKPNASLFSLSINGQLRQQGQTALMIHSISDILIELAENYGLRSGDLVFTGTPSGVGKLHSGDKLRLTLEDIIEAEFVID